MNWQRFINPTSFFGKVAVGVALVAVTIATSSVAANAQVATKNNPVAWGAAAAYQYSFFQQNAAGLPCYVLETPDSSLCSSMSTALPVYVETLFDSFQGEFYLQVKYPRTAGKFPEGISFVVNSGNMPEKSGEWAIVYVDASKNISAPVLSAYAYNAGKNGILDSWKYGNKYTSPTGTDGLPADPIVTTLKPPAGFHTGTWSSGLKLPRRVSVEDVKDTVPGSPLNGLDLRVFTIIIDAAPLLNHKPKYPGGASWKGVDIGGGVSNPAGPKPKIGAWIWAFNGLSTTYNAEGYLTNWLVPASAGFGFSSYELVNKGVNDWCPIDCTGTIWGTTASCSLATPTPTPTPGTSSCRTQEFTNNLFALDGGAAGLNEVVKYASKRLVALSRDLPRRQKAANNAFAEESKKASEDQFIVAWSISWSFPQFLTQCTGQLTANCTTQDLTAKTTNYLDSTSKIDQIAAGVSDRLRRIRSGRGKNAATRVDKMAAARLQEAVDFTKTVPSSTVQCKAP